MFRCFNNVHAEPKQNSKIVLKISKLYFCYIHLVEWTKHFKFQFTVYTGKSQLIVNSSEFIQEKT